MSLLILQEGLKISCNSKVTKKLTDDCSQEGVLVFVVVVLGAQTILDILYTDMILKGPTLVILIGCIQMSQQPLFV